MRLLALLLAFFACSAAAQTNNFNTLDRGGIQVLCKSAVAVSAPADTSEDTLATCAVPAGAMGANGTLRITAVFSYTNNANVKTLRVRYSGASGTQFLNTGRSTQVTSTVTITLANRASTASQTGSAVEITGTAGTTANQVNTATVDTTGATSIIPTCQKATGTDACTLESFLVELMPSN